MDPLSTAASGIAVISLAVQLAGSVQDIYHFLRGMNDAPKEFARLVGLLEQLHCILDGIQALHSKEKPQDSIPKMHSSVMSALKMCQSRVDLLEGIVDKAKSDPSKSSKVSNTFASLKLTLKKKDVEEFESQLARAMMMLQTSLTASSWQLLTSMAHTQLTQTQSTSTMVADISLLKSNVIPNSSLNTTGNPTECSPTEISNSCNQLVKKSSAMCPKGRQATRVCTWHKYMFGMFVYQTTSKYTPPRKKSIDTSRSKSHFEETIFTFILSFFSRCIELRIRNEYGKVSRTITDYPVVEGGRGDPIYKACQYGDLETLRSAFSEQTVSPYVIYQDGDSLLNIAARNKNPEVCKFLLQLGVDPNYTNHHGAISLIDASERGHGGIPYRIPLNDIMDTLEVIITYGQADLIAPDPMDYTKCLVYCPPEAFEFILDQDMVEDYIKSWEDREIFFLLGRMLERSNMAPGENWERLMARIMRMRYNLYKAHDRSLLDFLFAWSENPDRSKLLSDKWLHVLSSSGVDVRDYLETEIKLHPGTPPLTEAVRMGHGRCLRQLIFNLKENPSVYWDWWVDSIEPASLVCIEFKDISYDLIDDFMTPSGSWDTVGFRSSDHWINGCPYWPFTCPVYWSACDGAGGGEKPLVKKVRIYYGFEDEMPREKSAEQITERFERRMRKKAAKQRKAMGFGKNPKIPGGWIE